MNIKNVYLIYISISLFIFFFFFFPFLYLGENSFVISHDNLDSDVVWFKTISESGKLFLFSNDVKLDNIMNGIPRNSLPPAFNLISFLFFLLSPFNAFFMNKILTHFFAFLGMFLLLKSYVFKKQEETFFLFSVSLMYFLVPFYGTLPGLSIAGIPMVAWCFVNFYKGTSKNYHFFSLFFFTFYSSLIYSGIFIIITLSLILTSITTQGYYLA
jgi:hypothetical protein